jgi:amino acid transporter
MDKKIGLIGAISIGIGGMIGGGIFAVLGEAVSFAHGATVIAFFLAGVVALLTSYSYAKFSVTFQNRGGTVVFLDNAFGHNLCSGSLNLLLWLSYLVTISLYSVAFASYAKTLFNFDGAIFHHILISIAIILPAGINLISASFVSKSESIIVGIKISLLVLIIVGGVFFVDSSRLSPVHWGSGLSIFVAGMIIFVAYEGFELIANSSEEIKNPTSNLPKAFYSSVIFVIILYMLISVITVGTVEESTLLKAKDYALAVAAKPVFGQIGFTIVAIAALLATFSAINATIYGNARLSLALAKNGELPEKLDKEKKNIPYLGVWITTIFSLILANSIDLTEIAIIGSAGFLLIFTFINFSAFKINKQIKANRYITLIAFIASLGSLITLLIHTYEDNPIALHVFVGFIVFSILFELFYGKYVRGHFFGRCYQ